MGSYGGKRIYPFRPAGLWRPNKENSKLSRGQRYEGEEEKRIGKVGELDDSLERHSILWRLVLNSEGPSLNELRDRDVWDLYKVYEFNALLDMRTDQGTAVNQTIRDDSDKPEKEGL